MFKPLALALLAASLLAGCGQSPQAAPLAPGHATQPRAASAEKVRAELRVPARVQGYVDDYLEALEREYETEMERDMYGRPMYPKYAVKFSRSSRQDFKLVVSADGFKTTYEENGYNGIRRQEGRDFIYPFVAPVGPVAYYIEVRASIYTRGSDKLVKRLPVHYISNMGENFQGRLERAKL